MSSSSMSPSNGVVLATAMAVSGTVILLAMRLQKSLTTTTEAAAAATTTTTTQFLISPVQQPPAPRSCISPDGRKREKKKKKVHFAQDVVDTRGSSEEFRRRLRTSNGTSSLHSSLKNGRKMRDMPANRMALYNGMLKDRVLHRVAYSY
ncbi:hypothetical protein RJ639_021425 [Escallonia herrerae]|uniref:Uncharacterized protein n=1 Tax=Escallonia herrerae TaxID=1293975 RepID=A0AA88V738_9ASTE|nr:hypothetical protein RJ639_021425 [Escallonia herrerae]